MEQDFTYEHEVMKENSWLRAQHKADACRLDGRIQMLRQKRGELNIARGFNYQTGETTLIPHHSYVSEVFEAAKAVAVANQTLERNLTIAAMAVSECLEVLIEQAAIEMNADLENRYYFHIKPTKLAPYKADFKYLA